MTELRNIDDVYKKAMISEWEAYDRSGRTEQASYVAEVLLAHYDYDVHAGVEEEKEEAVVPPAPENTAAVKPPETAVEPKPDTVRPQTPAKKTAAKKTTAAPAKD